MERGGTKGNEEERERGGTKGNEVERRGTRRNESDGGTMENERDRGETKGNEGEEEYMKRNEGGDEGTWVNDRER